MEVVDIILSLMPNHLFKPAPNCGHHVVYEAFEMVSKSIVDFLDDALHRGRIQDPELIDYWTKTLEGNGNDFSFCGPG